MTFEIYKDADDVIRVRLGRRAKRSGSTVFSNKRKGGLKRGGRGAFKGTPGKYSQRVTVKFRVGKTFGRVKLARLRAHVSYLSREGVGEDGKRALFFDKHEDLALKEVRVRAKEWEKDRHHFRVIVSPEKTDSLDLKEFTRRVVHQMESDLGTALEFFGTAHFNTEKPHVHLVIRGKDERKKDLLIAKSYIAYGARKAASNEPTRTLGYRTELDLLREGHRSLSREGKGIVDYWIRNKGQRKKQSQIERMKDELIRARERDSLLKP
jgi:type IV secretory pathway VirD2 relaxase